MVESVDTGDLKSLAQACGFESRSGHWVYAAEHLMLGRRVAVKMLRDEFMGDAGLRARFTAEARAMAEIGHEHIVSVLDIGAAPGGSLYFVMEHLRGEDLADTLAREGRLPWLRVRSIGLQLCLGLAACHAKKDDPPRPQAAELLHGRARLDGSATT
jgi:serine/threonine protein kinase